MKRSSQGLAKNVSGQRLARDNRRKTDTGSCLHGELVVCALSASCPHIFSHPDYDRRLWHHTRSADPTRRLHDASALAGSSRADRRTGARHTAGGDFHPALKTH
jgi:hypothetical protein